MNVDSESANPFLNRLLFDAMDPGVVAALIGLPGGIVIGAGTSLYTVGGKLALQRRVIRQESEMIERVGGPERHELQRLVETRIAIYLARFVPMHKRDRRKLLWKAVAVVGTGVLAGIGSAVGLSSTSSGPRFWVALVTYALSLAVNATWGLALCLRVAREMSKQTWESQREVARERLDTAARRRMDL